MTSYPQLPPHIEAKLKRAARLEYWTLFWLANIVLVMYVAMGSSQAMKTAWIEDAVSLLPPLFFLVALRLERKPPTDRYPFGFHRVGSLAFFAAALALAAVGGYLLVESIVTLVTRDHPTIGSVRLFGNEVWQGWLMMAALLYSVIPPIILGHMKKTLAREINDKVLFTDADMNAADWQTGLTGIVGLAGIAFGYWWADAAAAGLISFSILYDGLKNSRTAFAELIDGTPRKIGSAETSHAASQVRAHLEARFKGRSVQVRETGRYMRALVSREHVTPGAVTRAVLPDQSWRLLEVSLSLEDDTEPRLGPVRPPQPAAVSPDAGSSQCPRQSPDGPTGRPG